VNRTGSLIAAAGGVLLLVAPFLTWYSRDTDIAGAVIHQTWNAWQALPVITTLLYVIAVASIALALVPSRVRSDRMLVVLGLLGLLLVAFRAIDLPLEEIDLVEGDSADSSRGAGLFLALIATAAIAYGGRRAGADRR
jgi:hypothetical protein